MPKIAIIGAGGVIFAKRFIIDILLRDSQLASMGLNTEGLANARRIGEALATTPGILGASDLEEALTGAGCSLAEVRAMVGEMFVAFRDVIPAEFNA